MKIIVDAFGGDNAPLAVLKGSQAAVNEYGVQIVLCGNSQKIKKCAKENNVSLNNIEIIHAEDEMDMHDDPGEILKSKSNSSLAVAFKSLVEGKGDAVVSAGNTGAILFGAIFIVKRIKGVKRPALAPVIQSAGDPYLLIDSGANINVRPDVLLQFGVLGSIYMNKVLGIDSPKVGLLNNGTEESKGGEVLVEAYQLLSKSDLNFIGNVEARDVPNGACDVLVADGFAGNIVLKLTEGVVYTFINLLRQVLTKNIFTKMAALVIKSAMKSLKKKLDYTEYGGAPLLGISKPVIKAHGSSNAKAIKNAIRQAKLFCEKNVIDEIKDKIS